jgi:hypothetical protein
LEQKTVSEKESEKEETEMEEATESEIEDEEPWKMRVKPKTRLTRWKKLRWIVYVLKKKK